MNLFKHKNARFELAYYINRYLMMLKIIQNWKSVSQFRTFSLVNKQYCASRYISFLLFFTFKRIFKYTYSRNMNCIRNNKRSAVFQQYAYWLFSFSFNNMNMSNKTAHVFLFFCDFSFSNNTQKSFLLLLNALLKDPLVYNLK